MNKLLVSIVSAAILSSTTGCSKLGDYIMPEWEYPSICTDEYFVSGYETPVQDEESETSAVNYDNHLMVVPDFNFESWIFKKPEENYSP